MDEIVILASEDTHYSIAKGSNLLGIDWLSIPVDFETRKVNLNILIQSIEEAKNQGKKYFITVINMGTTMFGSVDDFETFAQALHSTNVHFKMHVDGAYGGFVYPFLNPNSNLNFANPLVSSITVDAHKMLQAPYGTGIFLCRKGFIEHVLTQEAAYVEGMDLTLCGSRSGANAVAVWMILTTYGPNGWFEKVKILQMRTDWLCEKLKAMRIAFFREPAMNLVTIKAQYIPNELALKYDLVPQKHDESNQWYKIVLMEHVEIEPLEKFLEALKDVSMVE